MNLQISFSGSTTSVTGSYPQLAKLGVETKQQSSNSVKDSEQPESNSTQLSMGEEQLVRSIDRAIKALQGPETAVEISVHEKTRAFMVKVLNKETGEVIREIPPEKTLELVAKMMEFAGLIIDERR
ncbi:flagellar protein FlaG [Paenibacillus sp. GCM10012307]|uniref:Flagellar protein FlaG n=2 Tax=Paenibacillus roseus TaxID=2798579 RepID=A0A934J7X3_9BACL|nr:flagellar protein FlaG [Paenibacillus roseus]